MQLSIIFNNSLTKEDWIAIIVICLIFDNIVSYLLKKQIVTFSTAFLNLYIC
jgi:hypothetical protein